MGLDKPSPMKCNFFNRRGTVKNFLTQPFKKSETHTMIFLILFIALLGFISMDIYFPSLPAIGHYFRITHGESQLTITLYLCGFGFSQLIYGPCADYIGRRPVLLIGFFIYLLGSLLLVGANTTTFLLTARLIQGIGAGAGASLCRVIVRDKFIGNKMAQIASYITIGIAFATAVAPALGGLIQDHIGFRGNFAIMLIFGLITTLLIILFLPETHPSLRQPASHPINCITIYKKLLTHTLFIRYTLCSGLSLAALLTYAIINPFLLESDLGLSASAYGLITLGIASGELLGTYINGCYVLQVGREKMLRFGIIILMLSGFTFVLETATGFFNGWSVALPSFFITFAIGITIPNATASAFSSIKDSIGTAGALYGFFQISTTVAVTYLITILYTQTQNTLGVIIVVISFLSLFFTPESIKVEKK